MVTLYCADCGERFEPDDDHVQIEAEAKRVSDRNEMVGEYVFHPECWRRLSDDWTDPA